VSEDFDALSLFAMAELSQLRAQALDLFDRCLVDRNPAPIVAFIERQVMSDPPHLPLLQEFARSLQQRLLSLRAYHYDVRDKVIKTLAEDYGVDITPFAPPSAIEDYHKIDPQQVIGKVREQLATDSSDEVPILGKLLEASVETAARLQSEIQLTRELHTLVTDWLDALSATVGRRYWSEGDSAPTIH
jgi:hypothetical protein